MHSSGKSAMLNATQHVLQDRSHARHSLELAAGARQNDACRRHPINPVRPRPSKTRLAGSATDVGGPFT